MIGISVSAPFQFLQVALRDGRFGLAFDELDRRRRELENKNFLEFTVLRSELCLETGRTSEAVALAQSIRGRKDLTHELSARAQRVEAIAAFYAGDVENSLAALDIAAKACGRGHLDVLRAQIELFAFSVGLGSKPIEAVLAHLHDVRRSVMRAADPHLMVLLRMAVARAEARRFSPIEAQRHHRTAINLVDVHPNVWLKGLLHIDMSAIAMLVGDFAASLGHAESAMKLAAESGHVRTHVAAVINISQIMAWKGDHSTARRYVDLALTSAAGNTHLMRAALDSLANLLISAGEFGECHRLFKQSDVNGHDSASGPLHWDAVTELNTRARLAQSEGRWRDAARFLSDAIKVAESCGDQVSVRRSKVSRAHCFGLEGRRTEASIDLEDVQTAQVRDPESVSRFYGALSALEHAGGQTERAKLHLRRAVRIAIEMENKALSRDLRSGFDWASETDWQTPSKDVPGTGTLNDLDSAVALLELSGHPHILAREAFAILQETGCVEAVALAATGTRTPRVIDAHGWTSADAQAALRTATQDHLIPVGQHRDETWQVLVRPRPELDHRCTLAALRKLIATARTLDQYRRDEKQRAALWPVEALDGDPESLWISEQSAELVTLARRIAATPLPILLTGETGTGKEMLARIIHRASDRADKPLLPFNCTAVPRDMLESQLFGYRRGAFTGADTSFPGVIRAAAGGTLFLDEIGEIGIDLQPKLLRFLEYQEVHPLGEPHPVKVDVRIIAATNANVEQLVAQGRFREDLFYRLNGLRLPLPPLRERREEIPPLVHHYMRKFGDEQRKGRLTLSDETLEYLLLYNWPGNIRQLANEVRRMIALAEPDATLTPGLLSPEIQASRRTIPADTGANEAEIRVRLDQPLPDAVQMLEQVLVRRALERSHGRVEEAARLLGISRKGLFLKRRRWGLPRES
jgi:DNA-binding NtrC family response regulator/tetratricopeptide (TPR) repeat protein